LADVFVSYTEADCKWAFWLGQLLERLGHVAHVHAWEIGPGGDIMAWMEKRHDEADHVLCVVSATYLTKAYSALERHAAQWAAAGGRPNFLLLAFVEACEPPKLLAPLKRCELFGLTEDEARARFCDYLNSGTRPAGPVRFPADPGLAKGGGPAATAALFPGPQASISNIPLRVPNHFLGRDALLADIATQLRGTGDSVMVTALHGLRGVGKSTLAAAYAERHRSDYRATWWIRAQAVPSIRADLVALGVRLGWISAEDKEEPALPTVMLRLQDQGEGLLLIFDNAIAAADLGPFLPLRGACRVLVTSNDDAWRRYGDPVEIKLWDKGTGADYLIARTGRTAERPAATALSDDLGGLPLAHEQAAAYCERLRLSFAAYRKRFKAAPVSLLDDARSAPTDYYGGRSVAKTFRLAIEEATRLQPAADRLITYAALLAPEPIPLFLFEEGRDTFGESFAGLIGAGGMQETISALRSFALVEIETVADEREPEVTTDTIRLHRLVREVVAGEVVAADRDAARGVLIRVLAAVYPQNAFLDPTSWPRARRLNPLALAGIADVSLPGKEEARVADLLSQVALFHHLVLAAFDQALPLFRRALAINQEVLGTHHGKTIASMDNLAILLQDRHDLDEAQDLHQQALAVRQAMCGPDSAETAAGLTNLGFLLKDRNDLPAAEGLFARALAIRQAQLGPDDTETAASLTNLAFVAKDQGRFAEAQPLFERALNIRTARLGPMHPDVATSLTDLGFLLKDSGNLAGAQINFQRALEIRTAQLGPFHPDSSLSLSNLGFVLQDRGVLAEAKPLFEQALAIRERVFGPQHPTTAVSLNNLASLLVAQGNVEEGLTLYKQALPILERSVGTANPDTVEVRANIARLSGQA
jgi:tetratricopeptide (TPR) repeat protein